MRICKTQPLGVLAIAAIGFLLNAPATWAQNHVIAIGKVSSAGAIVNSANTLGAGASVTASPNGTGDYTITVTSASAFSGNDTDDFIGEVTCEDASSDDQVPKIRISSVNANQLTVLVHTDDVEDTVATNLAEAANNAFFFAIYRVPSSFPEKGSTKYLYAAGKVSSAGTLLSGVGIDGVAVASSRPGTGDFRVLLSKTGAFAGASADDFVILLSLNGTGVQDDAIRGDVSAIGDDVVTITVRIDDIQDETSNSLAIPANNTFHFTIYRIPAGVGTGLAQSRLLVGLGKVESDGNLLRGGAFNGSALASARDSEGRYTVTITSAGAFTGTEDNQFVLQVHLNQGLRADEVIEGDISVTDDVLTLVVTTNDGEQPGDDEGVATDAPFSFLIHDVEPDFRPDLRIGTKKNLTQQLGDDIYNAGAAGQKVNVGLKSTGSKKYWFTLENDGNLTDDIFLKAKRSGNKIKSKYFRITGGRQNITAAITSGTFVVDDVPPCKLIRYEAQAKYKKPNKRPTKTLRFLARSEFVPSRLDANKATLMPK